MIVKVAVSRLSIVERRRFGRFAGRVFAAMLGETDEFRREINALENVYVTLSLVGRIIRYAVAIFVLAFAAGAALAFGDGLSTGEMKVAALQAGAAAFAFSLFLSLITPRRQDEAYQNAALLYVAARKIENYWFVPVFGRRRKTRRDARRNKSGEMVRAVERRIQLQPALIAESAARVGRAAPAQTRDRSAGLPDGLIDAIERLTPETPAVRVKKLFERKLMIDYLRHGLRSPPEEANLSRYFYLSRGARNAIRAGLVLHALGSIMRDERRSNPGWRRSYVTSPREQVTVLEENEDMRLRFRTASPHLSWPDPGDLTVGDFETAQHLVIQCVHNPMEMPIFTISANDVIAKLSEAIEANRNDQGVDIGAFDAPTALHRLLSNAPVMYSRWNTAALRHRDQTPINQPILRNLSEDPDAPDYVIRWDPNRIDWSVFDELDQELRFAFAALFRAVKLAGAEACGTVLRRGDGLIIDNQRCLVARREFCDTPPAGRLKFALGIDPVWDLKAYTGFRPVSMGSTAGGA